MIPITGKTANDYDLDGNTIGFIEVERATVYERGDQPPTDPDINPIPPCFVIEILDEKYSTKDVKLLKPFDWVPLNDKQTEFFRRNFAMSSVMHITDKEVKNG